MVAPNTNDNFSKIRKPIITHRRSCENKIQQEILKQDCDRNFEYCTSNFFNCFDKQMFEFT